MAHLARRGGLRRTAGHAVPDPATPAAWDGAPFELREILVHLIEGDARHNGHADLLRERIDGRVGQ